MEDNDGWSLQVGKGGKVRGEIRKVLLKPTAAPTSKSTSGERKVPPGSGAGSHRAAAAPQAVVSSARGSIPPGKSSGVQKEADRSVTTHKGDKKVPEFSVADAAPDAFPALGSTPNKPAALKTARGRLVDVRVTPPALQSGAASGPGKRASKVTLFDLILKGSNDAARPNKPQVPKVALKTTVEAVSAKHVIRKKKKRASNLKRALRKERQSYYDSLQLSPAAAADAPHADAPLNSVSSPSNRTVELLRFIDDSIEDGEELDEVLDSTRELMQLFGSVQAISVAHHDTERVMLITFLNGDDALRARDAMHNSVYGGIKVEANLVKTPVEGANIDTDKTLAAVFPDRKVLSRAVSADRARVIPGLNSDERRLYDNHSILNIINFVFPKDIEDEDEAQDVLNDTLMLCEKFSPAAVWLENHDSESIVLLHTDENNIEADGCPLGILVFKSLTEAAICRDYICSSSNLSAFLINANLPDINFLNVSQMFGATIDDAKICEPATSLIKMNDNFCLKIGHFVDKDEIMDEVERCDIVSEIRSLCERKLVERLRGMGLSMTMSIPTIDCVLFGQFISDELLERSAGSFPLDDTTAMLDVYVIINATKQSLLDVVHLLYALSGVLVGGLLLDMSICCINSNVLSGMISSFDIRNGAGSIQALDGCLVGFEHSDIHVLNETTASQQSTVAVLGLPWQVNGAFSSIETSAMSNSQLLQHALWRFEWKMSLLSSCGYPGTSALLSLVLNDDHDQINKSVQSAAPPNFFNNLWYVTITSINPLHCTAQVKNLKYLIHSKEAKAKSLEVCVAFASVHHATAALLYLENLTIGGSNISVCVKFGSFYCPKQNTDSVSRTFDASVSSLSSGLSATARVFEPKSSLVKPAPAEVSVEIIPPAEKARVTADVSAASATVISAPPRLPRRTTGIIGVKRATSELDVVIKTFLSALASFQKRVKETDPLNFNRKRRFMFGMKQARNAIKSGRAKFIFIAPDFEDSEVLDDKLDEVIEEAKHKGTPMLYCLSRRQLAKAAGATMRQVVVAVLDADGAYDAFKIIKKFVADDDA